MSALNRLLGRYLLLHRRVAIVSWPVGLVLLTWLMAACQTQPNQVFIEVDGRRQTLTTEAQTVRDALTEANIILESLDRVSPDLYTHLEPGVVIEVTRVVEDDETEREVIPFERQIVTNEALNPGETKIAQLGVNGEAEITIRVVYENGAEVSRREVSREVVIEPQPEILVVGPEGELPAITIDGTIAYLANGNAWLMRDTSSGRRTLTTEGDLDGRVFDLSPDGRYLAYTRQLTDEIDLPLNELWLASTAIINEPPVSLDIQGVLYAEWSPVISQSRLIYSTAERTSNPPGWQANNDLWLLTLPRKASNSKPKSVELLPANTQGLYPWWGMNFAWSPDGQNLAYARADQIGIITVSLTQTLTVSDSLTILAEFTPLQTFSDWVWVPQLSWSTDGQFISAAIHGPSLTTEAPEDSQVFDLWLFSADGSVSAKIADQVGMWANPVWGETGIAFGEAMNPLQSSTSRYTLQLIDRDGSNQRQIFPISSDTGVEFPEMAWSPLNESLLFIDNGDLYLMTSPGSPPRQLTQDSQASFPQWSATIAITPTLTVSPTLMATLTAPSTPTRRAPSGTATSIRGTPQPTITASITMTPTTESDIATPSDIEAELKGEN